MLHSDYTDSLPRAGRRSNNEIIVEPLPKYAPERNPEELCHGNVKRHLKNATPSDTLQVRQLLDRGFARLRRRPDMLLRFIHRAGLVVKQLWLL